jgi:hypothetical protein
MQQNGTIKITYIPNTIGVLTHGVDLRHHGLPIGEGTPKSLVELLQEEERKRKEERKRGRKRKRG